MKVDVAVYNTCGWSGRERRQEACGKEEVGAGGKKPGLVIPWIVGCCCVVVFAVGMTSNEV